MDDYISRMVEKAFPQEFAMLKLSQHRGGWTTRPYNDQGYEGGVFLNRVALWKLGCLLHKDCSDMLCATCCGGSFIGGEAIFPDLGLKFRYVSHSILCLL